MKGGAEQGFKLQLVGFTYTPDPPLPDTSFDPKKGLTPGKFVNFVLTTVMEGVPELVMLVII